MTEKVFMSWHWVDLQIEVLADKIGNDSKFTIVTGIPRGGLIPAVMLSHKLGIRYVPYKEAIKASELVLVVDDIADTGHTLTEIGTKGFCTATLCCRYSTQYTPEYYGEEIIDDKWLVFPWEENDSKTIQGYLDN
tara:strand:+ start:1070 stop:1474 length:405 start_codon:yes stop_codon:yes gene_type:complete